jgi:hypothetical protein
MASFSAPAGKQAAAKTGQPAAQVGHAQLAYCAKCAAAAAGQYSVSTSLASR